MSYSEAGARAQLQASGGGAATAHLVGNWVETFSPVITRPRSEWEWPPVVVLDAKPYKVNLPGGGKGPAFTVLAVHGYLSPFRERDGRLWAVRAVPGAVTAAKWARFLQELSGSPVMAVTDHDTTTISGIRKAFPDTTVRLCRHHLGEILYGKLDSALPAGDDEHPLRQAARGALNSLERWRQFRVDATAHGLFQVTNWITQVDRLLTAEFAVDDLPNVRGNGAVENDLRQLANVIGNRAFCFKNAERTNRLLQLARLHINREDDVDRYAADIRTHLEAGKDIATQGRIRDEWGAPSLR